MFSKSDIRVSPLFVMRKIIAIAIFRIYNKFD
jgi:hypothetical protein